MNSPFDLIGHKEVMHRLKRGWRDGEGPRTLLFAGPAGVGKRLVAHWLAAYVNCDALPEARPCGVCASCQAVAKRTHLDVRELAPSTTTQSGKSKHRGEITIDRLVPRDGGDPEPLSEWLRSRPTRRYRVAIIDHAETMTAPAANAFLKTLEEPPPGTLIVLLAPGPDALLPTVASRASTVRFGAVATDEFGDLAPHPGLRLGQPGSLIRARSDQGATLAARDAAVSLLKACSGDLLDSLEAAEEFAAAINRALEAGAEPGPLAWLREPLRALPATSYAAALEHIESCEDALAAYGNPGLACAVLTLELRALFGSEPLPLGTAWQVPSGAN